jgi:cysteine desulfurase
VPVNVDEMNIDLLSISGHKIYGPKGVGALYVRRKPRVRLVPQMSGGGQEKGLRSGTLAPHLCVGLGEASRVAMDEMEYDQKHISYLNNKFYETMNQNLSHLVLNGDKVKRYDGNLNISFSCVEGESLIMAIKDMAVSSGSACTSASLEPSYVLRAIGVEEDLAHTSLRIGFGRFTTEQEVDYAIELITRQVNRLRDMSPLWDMLQEGVDIKSINWAQH